MFEVKDGKPNKMLQALLDGLGDGCIQIIDERFVELRAEVDGRLHTLEASTTPFVVGGHTEALAEIGERLTALETMLLHEMRSARAKAAITPARRKAGTSRRPRRG